MQKQLYILILLLGCFWGGNKVQAQPRTDSARMALIQEFEGDARSLIDFFEYMLNVLGDPQSTAGERREIIETSYLKIFTDASVQVEDDLSSHDVVTNKDIQAYLKDIGFFFKSAVFDFSIEGVSHGINADGKVFYLLHGVRTLKGITRMGDTINNSIPRFFEVNLDEDRRQIQLASIYSTRQSEEEELGLWWNEMPRDWKAFFADKIRIGMGLKMTDLLKSETIYMIGDSLPLSATDTLVLNQKEMYEDLKKLSEQTELDISGHKELVRLDPLSRFRQLRFLNISDTYIADLKALEHNAALDILHCENSNIKDFNALVNAGRLREIYASGSKLRDISALRRFTKLQILDCERTAVADIKSLSHLKYLHTLKLSKSSVSDISALSRISTLRWLSLAGTAVLDLKPIRNLQALDSLFLQRTQLNDLSPLRNIQSLVYLNIENSLVNNISPLGNLAKINQIKADNTPLSKEAAQTFIKANPSINLLYRTATLERWWSGLNENWKALFLHKIRISANPNAEQLHRIGRIDSLDLRGMKNIKRLEALAPFWNLNQLSIAKSGVTSLGPLRNLYQLESLDFSHTAINSLAPIRGLFSLKTLNTSYSKVNSIETVSSLEKLEILNCSATGITDFQSLTRLKNLVWLYADQTLITSDHILGLLETNPACTIIFQSPALNSWWSNLSPAWQDIFRQHHKMGESPSTEDLHGLIRLAKIELSDRQDIADLRPLQQFLKLKTLRIERTAISSLEPLTSINSLEILNCSRNPILDLSPLRELVQLRELQCEETPIEDLSPLAMLSSLEILEVSGTQIKDIKVVETLSNLQKIGFSNTKVRSIKPLETLAHLRQLKCFNTRLNPNKMDEFKANHKNVEVTFY